MIFIQSHAGYFIRILPLSLLIKNGKQISAEDVEHNAWINRSAKEELEIDTILGTLKEPSPAALGQFFLTSDKSVKKYILSCGRNRSVGTFTYWYCI